MWISDFSWFVNLLTIIIKVCNLCNVITSVLYSKRPEHYFLIKKKCILYTVDYGNYLQSLEDIVASKICESLNFKRPD